MKLDPRVQELVERIVTRQDLELVHVEMVGGRSPILRVYIDKPGGVTVDDSAAVSERLSLHLDVVDLFHRAILFGNEFVEPLLCFELVAHHQELLT